MRFGSPLISARLVRRYKRFLADAVLEADGREVTVHCPNPGAMTGLAEPGMRIWLEPNDDPRRKLGHGWRLVELTGGHLAGIDTGVPNRIVGEALRQGSIPLLADYPRVRPEQRYGTRSRIDFLLSGDGRPDLYLEVKNVHLRRAGSTAEFPDCVTARGARHLGELAATIRAGHRAMMLYVVQRTDCTAMDLARDLDPAYGRAFDAAADAGVEVLCLGTRIGIEGVDLAGPLPVHAEPPVRARLW